VKVTLGKPVTAHCGKIWADVSAAGR